MNTFDKLRSKGHRITNQREIVLEKIKDHPQTAEEIYNALNKNVDLASVYRTLKLFVKNKVVKIVNFDDGKKRYELLDEQNHHHHFICKNCNDVIDIYPKQEEKLLKEIQLSMNIKIENHSISLSGLCENCL